MKNHLVCLKEASVLDYYVSGFWWAKESSFSPEQIQAFMSLLQILMENLRTKRMTIADNLRELAAAMKEVSRSEADENDGPELFSLDESTCIIDFLKGSLFQHYKLYEFVFIHSRDDLFLRFQENIDVDLFINSLHAHPLEEGLSQDMYSLFIDVGTPEQPEEETLPEEQKFDYVIETPTRDPLEGFTVEDVKQVLQNITGSVVKNLQSEINKKLQQQEEDYLARLEKVIRS
ncbi:ciliary-associated calcium-binding coiled-coil protein 1-like [Polypterus senegalus]|uniref:ciliary-associated calcium-binding coiled-coil protein 1-like n=1 Tax=Polypterus senegalus TaxID=55291 RepID=UPI001964DFE6|nr:ciliary-associated calcium-binding coiled-coil protein 1-like [Polypterus senegalus]